jgi:Ca-activated chloride channel homolog
MIYFSRPIFLFYLLFIPFLVLVHIISLKLRKKKALRFANFDAIANIRGIDLLSRNLGILLVSMVIVLLVTFSLAGMQVERTIPATSYSFAIAVDASKSMEATDFTPNRLEAAKSTALSFVDISPPSTKFAVVSFSGNSFIEQSISLDKSVLREAISGIQLSSVGGTDLNEAVITSSNLLKGENGKAVVLISDGRINVGTIDDAIKYANDNQVIVYTIGIGTVEGGNTTYGMSKMDEDALKGLSFNTGGKYLSANNTEQLQSSFNTILDLKIQKVLVDVSNYLLITAIILIALLFILINTKYAIFP